MKIVYRPHLKRRITERKFPQNYPRKVYINSKHKFFDSQTRHNIAVSKLRYAGRMRNLSISYDIIRDRIEIITIHPITKSELQRKVKNKRWRKI